MLTPRREAAACSPAGLGRADRIRHFSWENEALYDPERFALGRHPEGLLQDDVAAREVGVLAPLNRPSITDNDNIRGWWGRDPDAWTHVRDQEHQEAAVSLRKRRPVPSSRYSCWRGRRYQAAA
jgi:hypothetical protein